MSRQTGARGRTIGKKLQAALSAEAKDSSLPWALFDDDLVKKVLEDNHLPLDLEKFMPDDAVSEVEGSINEILVRHPSLWSLFEKTVRTIVRLSRMGHSIIVGRGGNFITHGFSNVLNVRLIGSEEVRIAQMVKLGMSAGEALKFIKEEDTARKNYIKQHFKSDIDNSMSYDLTINTDKLKDEEVVEILVAAINSKWAALNA
ncbi:MAG: cytidylate kinase-like family protein [Opitutales bacterium]|nr:cytidylate kinase-like family protein [Opitutales bacterium]